MLANVEMIKGDVGHTVVVCVLGRVVNRVAQIQEILPKIVCAFSSTNYQLLFKKYGGSPF